MALDKTVFFKKLVDGAVHIYMQDFDGVLPARWFVMDQRMPRIGVPMNYALTVFSDHSVELMLKKNYVEIENMDVLIREAEARSIIAPSQEEVKELTAPKRTKEMIFSILKGANESKIRELFESADRERALGIATERINELSLDAVAKIESILGVAIKDEE